MREIILNALREVRSDTNLQSQAGREAIANALEKVLNEYINNIIEDVVCGGDTESE